MAVWDDVRKKVEEGLQAAFKAVSPQDLDKLYAETRDYSVGEWRNLQLAAAASGGFVGAAIPGVHLAGLAADLVHVLYRMARSSMGVGAILGRRNLKENILGEEDFLAVLAQWADPQSLSDIVQLKLEAGFKKVSIKTLGKVLSKAIAKKAGLVGTGVMAEKLFGKVAAKFAAKFGAKVIAGWVFLLGPVVSAGINVYFLKKISDAAEAFYPKKIKVIERHS